LHRSVTSNRLLNEASTLKKCGPKNELRATFPNVPGAGRLHGPRVQPFALSSGVGVAVVRQPGSLVSEGAVTYQAFWVGLSSFALPTRLARHGPVSSS